MILVSPLRVGRLPMILEKDRASAGLRQQGDRAVAIMSAPPVPAYVLWLGPTGLTIVRALGRRGIPVVACHDDPNEPCAGTRYARVKFLPPLDQDEDAWLSFLLDEARSFNGRKAVLLVATDAHWLFVARHRRALSEHFVFPLPEAPDLHLWPTKPWQQAIAACVGIDCPRQAFARSERELRDAGAAVKFPCLLKPDLSARWINRYREKLAFIRDEAELMTRGLDALANGLVFTVQEYIPGDDSDIFGLYCALDERSQPLGLAVSRKIRQFEPRFGSGAVSETVDQPEIVELGLRLLQAMNFHGIASVEFKRDHRDGRFKFFEANLRSPLMMADAIDSGVDLPYAMYRSLTGEPLALQKPARLGRRVGLFNRDLHVAQFYRRLGRLTYRRWLLQWLRIRDLHFAWDDWKPFTGYLHLILDHARSGRYRTLPATFPSLEQWSAGLALPQPAVHNATPEPSDSESDRLVAAA